MNTLFCSPVDDFWLDVVKGLKSDSDVNAVYWLGKGKISGELDDCFYHDEHEACNLDGGYHINPRDLPSVPLNIFSRLDYFNFLKILDRMDIEGSFSFSERDDLFKRQIEYWLYVFELRKIDFVFFSNTPHFPMQYIIYLIAKYKNVKVLMFNVSPFKGWHYLTTEVGGKSIIGSGKEHKVNIDEEFLKPFRWGTFENPWYMKEQLKKTRLSWVRKFINSTLFFSFAIFFDKYLLSFLLNNKVSSFVQVIKNKFIRTKSRGVSYKIKSKSLIDFINLYSISKKINSRNFRDFKNNSSFFDVEKEEDYVYIPLHYQPELTSCPLGGDFADQIFLIREVAKKIPKNFKIVVKEHSSQFHNGLQGYCGRHPGYYADIAKINNVVICAMDTPSIDLIRNCKFVVTVTGTAGWEAIVNGKVCICVGEAWYKYFPNVINAGVDDLKDKIELALSKEKFQEINGKYINDLFLKYSIKADLHNYFNGGIPRDAEIVKNHIAQALLQINCSYQKL